MVEQYIAGIRNKAKQAYAEAYLRHRKNGGPEPLREDFQTSHAIDSDGRTSRALSYMAAQAVRMRIDSILSQHSIDNGGIVWEFQVRTVTLPAVNLTVSLAAYVRAIKTALANPDMEFKHGLTTWWPTKGSEVMRQFREGMHDRISQGIPYSQRGL